MQLGDFKLKKEKKNKITMLTCYDYPSARIIAESSIDCVLVGDSVAMAVHGHATTLQANMDMMVLHTQAVARGLSRQFLITDLPFLGHRRSQTDTVDNVKRLLQAGAQAIKIEGGDPNSCDTIAYLTACGIPIIGHIGLTPQFIHQFGGFKVQGKSKEQAEQIIQQAKALQNAGCIALVIECVPQSLAKVITESLSIPTVGIGAGVATDGQVLVWHDLLGLQTELKPKFIKHYIQGKAMLLQAVNAYVQQVREEQFPSAEYAF